MTAHAEWKYQGEADTFFAYFDVSKIRTEGQYKSMWILLEHKSRQTVSDKTYISEVRKQVIDCQASKFQSVAVYLFSDPWGKGEIAESANYSIKESAWQYPPPNTWTDKLVEVACGRK